MESIDEIITLKETTELTTKTLFGFDQTKQSNIRIQQERFMNNRAAPIQRNKPTCLCGETHSPQQCNKFSSPEERRAEARRQRVCWRCFSKGHNSRLCSAVSKCPKCSEDHHSSLCTSTNQLQVPNSSAQRGYQPPGKFQTQSRFTTSTDNNRFKQPPRSNNQQRESSRVQALPNTTPQENITVGQNQPPLNQHVLQIASALIFNESEFDYQTITLLLDSGAQRSFIKSSLGASLKLPTFSTTSFTTIGMGELQESFKSDEVRITLKSCHSSTKLRNIPVFTKDKLTTTTRTANLSEEDRNFIKGKKISIAQRNLLPMNVSPDILIGQDLLHQILDHNAAVIKLPSGLVLTPTIFGYTISGTSGFPSSTKSNSEAQCSSLIVATPLISQKTITKWI
ncbi:Tas retrotransposon peptidase A16 [Ostertagia ostertagi]